MKHIQRTLTEDIYVSLPWVLNKLWPLSIHIFTYGLRKPEHGKYFSTVRKWGKKYLDGIITVQDDTMNIDLTSFLNVGEDQQKRRRSEPHMSLKNPDGILPVDVCGLNPKMNMLCLYPHEACVMCSLLPPANGCDGSDTSAAGGATRQTRPKRRGECIKGITGMLCLPRLSLRNPSETHQIHNWHALPALVILLKCITDFTGMLCLLGLSF